MAWEFWIYLVPYIIALAISLGVGLYAWQRRDFAPALSFALFTFAEGGYTAAYLLEVLSPGVNAKLFWDNAQLAAIYIAPLGFLSFALQYTTVRLSHPRRFWAALSALPLIGVAAVLTSPLHGAFRTGVHIEPGEPFDQLFYTFTPLFLLFSVYAYVLTLIACGLLARQLLRTRLVYRGRITTLVVGMFVPIIGAGMVILRINHVFYLESIPLSFAISNVILAWGLFRYQLLEVVPVAQAAIIENLRDAVLVVDLRRRLLDYNPAAQKLAQKDLQVFVGQPLHEVFPQWGSGIEAHKEIEREERFEVVLDETTPPRTVEVRLSPVLDMRGVVSGRLITVRDISGRKRTEEELRTYRENLEERIAERTEALTAAIDRLKTEVAERERAQQALQVSEDRYRRATSAGKVGVWEWDANDNTLYIASELRMILGYGEHDLTATPDAWEAAIHPDDLPLLNEELRNLLRGRAERFAVDVRVLHKDRSVRWMAMRGDVICDAQGAVRQLVGTASDITDLMQTQHALQRRDAILQVVNRVAERLLRSGDWAAEIDAILADFGAANAVDRAVLFRATADDGGRLYGQLHAVWSAPGITDHRDDAQFQQIPIGAPEFVPMLALWSNGEPFAAHTRNLPPAAREWVRRWGTQSMLHVPVMVQGGLWGLLSLHMVRDTREWQASEIDALRTAVNIIGTAIERQQAREALQQYADRLRVLHEIDKQILAAQSTHAVARSALQELVQLVPNTWASVTIFDLEASTATVLTAHEATGMQVDEGTTVPLARFEREQLQRGGVWVIGDMAAYDGKPEISPTLQALIDRGIHAVIHVPLRYEGILIGTVTLGHDKPHHFSADDVDAVQQVAAQIAIVVHQAYLHAQVQQYAGVLEQRVAERTAELEAAMVHLRALTRLKDEFVSNVSHELRTPISNLKLYLDLLHMRPERAASYGEVLERETDRLEMLIEDLLTLSRLDQDRVMIRRRLVDLNTLVREYVMDRRVMAESQGLTLVCTAVPDLPHVQADPGLIGQVLSILLTNAFNYTPQGGRVTVCTRAVQRDGTAWAAFCVSDDGPGIPPGEQPRLFTRFFRGQVGLDSGASGTGLGLAIAKEIIDRHEGVIEVASTGVAGEGATFTVLLPLCDAREQEGR